MPGLQLPILLAIPTILVALLLTRAPFMMTAPAPSEKPWADGPMKLIPTPLYQTNKVPYCALAHSPVSGVGGN